MANNNNFSNVRNLGRLTQTRRIVDSVSASNKVDTYRFRLGSSNKFQGILRNLSNNADLELFDRNRERIAFSRRPGRKNERVREELEAGVYFLQVKHKRGIANYTLRLSANPIDDNPDSDSITVGETTTTLVGSISGNQTERLYQVNLDTSGNFNLSLSGLSANADVQLLDNRRTVIDESTQIGTTIDTLNANLKAGTYFVRVFSPETSTTATNYSLNVRYTPLELYGLAADNTLVGFNPDNTNAVSIDVTGLINTEQLIDIDFRPLDRQLVGLTNQGRLYVINPETGAADRIDADILPVNQNPAGIDINPINNRLRFVSSVDQNLQVVFTSGDTIADTNLRYASTDVNRTRNPDVVSLAHSSNRLNALATTLYGIDSNLDTLVTLGSPTGSPTSPGSGELFTIGNLGVNFGSNVGFDIFTDNNRVEFAYATTGTSRLYSIDLSTGAATSLTDVRVDNVDVAITGLAARLSNPV